MNQAAKKLQGLAADMRDAAEREDVRTAEYERILVESKADAERYRALAAEYESAVDVLMPPPVPSEQAA